MYRLVTIDKNTWQVSPKNVVIFTRFIFSSTKKIFLYLKTDFVG